MSRLNGSGWMPLPHHVVVLVEQVDEKTAGGLIRPDQIVDRDQQAEIHGVLVENGPGAFDFVAAPKSKLPKPGDRVIFAGYGGQYLKAERTTDGRVYRVMVDKELIAFRPAKKPKRAPRRKLEVAA